MAAPSLLSSKSRAWFALSLLAIGSTGIHAQQASPDELQTLREQVRLLDQKVKVIERKQELKDEDSAAKAKTTASVTAGASGFTITSADKAFDLKLKALAQFDSRHFLDDGASNRDAFLLRRIRLITAGTVAGFYDFNITPELGAGTNNTSTVALWDAFFAARFSPQFGVRVGKFASAVGLEPGANRHFIESPFVNMLQPNRDLGAEIFGALGGGFVEYRLGAFIGAANTTTSFGGAAADNLDGDRTLAGRITITPFKKVGGVISKLSFGIGASRGNEVGTAGSNISNGLSNIASNSQQAIFSYGAVLYSNGDHTRISPSVEWYAGTPFSLAAEYALEKQDIAVNVAGLTRTFNNSAWRASAGWVLTGEEATKAGVTPKNPFAKGAGWGAFEVVARVSGLSLDSKLFHAVSDDGAGLGSTTNATGAFAYGVGVNWYLNRNVRFLLNAEQTQFDDAKTPAAQIGARDDELAVIARVQLSF